MSLTNKRRAFIEHYLSCWNATKAARKAGYAHPGAQGHRLLKNVEIQQEIKRRITEKAMTADEVLNRLADHARGSMEDFMTPVEGTSVAVIDLDKARKDGKLHLIKELSYIGGYQSKGGKVSIKLYDAQSALALIGKHLGLFKEHVEFASPGKDSLEVKHVIDPGGAAEILSILVEIGAVPSSAPESGDAEADEIRNPPADV